MSSRDVNNHNMARGLLGPPVADTALAAQAGCAQIGWLQWARRACHATKWTAC